MCWAQTKQAQPTRQIHTLLGSTPKETTQSSSDKVPHQTTAPAGQRNQVLGAQTGTQREQKPKQTCNRTVAAVCRKSQHRKDPTQPTNLSARGYTPAAATKTAPCMCGACTLHTMAPHTAWDLNLQRAQARADCAHVQRALHKHRQERCMQGGACAHPSAVLPLTSQHRKGIRMSANSAAVPITAPPMYAAQLAQEGGNRKSLTQQ